MAGLRETLTQAKQMYDPSDADAAFDRMVLLGHSMGGLLSHAMAVDSEDKFWQLNSSGPFSKIVGPPEILSELERYLFFKPLPFVERVVFLATPHHGSEMSRHFIGRLGAGLISEPDSIAKMLSQLIRDNPEAFDRRQFRRMPTSIETLDPDSPLLSALLEMKPSPRVTFHSIIGYDRPGPVATSTDGIVPYRSAHIDGVASEKRVRSDHGVQKAPEAILEVRRILHLHAGQQVPQLTTNPVAPVQRVADPAARPARR
jgi:triacylglycerol esterase/lipase EstA (alpha/beta hydrolase family)